MRKIIETPKKVGVNVSSSFKVTLNDGNHRSRILQMFSKKCFLKNFAISQKQHFPDVLQKMFS